MEKTNVSNSKKNTKKFIRQIPFFLMLILPIIWYIVFCYLPMIGIVIGFQDYVPGDPLFFGANWVGFKHLNIFISGPFFYRLMRNTIVLAFYGLIIGFPAPIILALLINEVTNKKVVKAVQNITYLPHFIAVVIICGIIIDFASLDGLFNGIKGLFVDTPPINYLNDKNFYRPIYVLSDVWAGIGWGSIIYIAALAGVDPTLYEAAEMDGAGRLKQMWHISLPSIKNTIVILFILATGGLLASNLEKTMLLARPITYEVSDVISFYVYRKGIEETQYSFSTAVSLFVSVVTLIFVFTSNYISKKASEDNSSLF
ncbi:MAG: ABC transporter permease [Lachnospirales bacterium]